MLYWPNILGPHLDYICSSHSSSWDINVTQSLRLFILMAKVWKWCQRSLGWHQSIVVLPSLGKDSQGEHPTEHWHHSDWIVLTWGEHTWMVTVCSNHANINDLQRYLGIHIIFHVIIATHKTTLSLASLNTSIAWKLYLHITQVNPVFYIFTLISVRFCMIYSCTFISFVPVVTFPGYSGGVSVMNNTTSRLLAVWI